MVETNVEIYSECNNCQGCALKFMKLKIVSNEIQNNVISNFNNIYGRFVE